MDSHTQWAFTCSKSIIKTLTSVQKRFAVKAQIGNQLIGFYMIQVFTERCFGTDRTTYEICSILTITSSILIWCLYC